jgi:thymidylate kinase
MTASPDAHPTPRTIEARTEGPIVHRRLRQAFDAFDAMGLTWVLLRTPRDGLGTPRGDVDLLLRDVDLTRGAELLVAAGFVRVPRVGASFHFLDYCADSDQWLWLHLVSTVSVGESVLRLGQDGLLPVRTQTAGAIPMLDEGAAFWLLIWHCVKKGAVAEHHRAALRGLSGNVFDRPALAQAVRDARPDLSTEDLVSAIATGNWDAAAVLIGAEDEAASGRRGSRGSTVRRLVQTVRSWRAGRRAPGISVAVLGPDGAGKTSLVEGLRASVPLAARVVYMGLTGGALEYATRLRVPGLVFVASAIVVWGRYARGRYHTALGRIVLFDRYAYDAVAPHARRNRLWHRASRQMLSRLCPAPDVVLVLNAPGTVMFARKGAYSADVLEDWRRRFLTLRERLPNVHVMDATQPAHDVRVEATRVIWRYLSARWTGLQATADDK